MQSTPVKGNQKKLAYWSRWLTFDILDSVLLLELPGASINPYEELTGKSENRTIQLPYTEDRLKYQV